MKTMNIHNLVLMQSWNQFGKMMNTMSFVGAKKSYKTTNGKVVFLTQAEHIIIVVQHLLVILSWNLSALTNFRKKSNFRKKQNRKTKLPEIMVVNQDQVSTWKQIIHCIHPMLG